VFENEEDEGNPNSTFKK